MTCAISVEFLPLSRRYVPPLKTSPATKSEEKRVYLQAIIMWAYLSCSFFLIGPMTTKSDRGHFLHWPRLFGQHSSVLASLILFAFLSTFSSFHSINCKKGQFPAIVTSCLVKSYTWDQQKRQGAGLLHSLRCVFTRWNYW